MSDGEQLQAVVVFDTETVFKVGSQLFQLLFVAVEAEREVDDMKMAEYMEGHIGEEFTGRISGLTNFGMFVELDNLIEGLVHISTLRDDFYIYNSDIMAIIGEEKKKMYRLGDEVRIKVIGANKVNKTIDFELVGNKNGNNQQKSEI